MRQMKWPKRAPVPAEQVANAMAFLCSPAASGSCGSALVVDSGQVGAGISGAFESPIIKILTGVS